LTSIRRGDAWLAAFALLLFLSFPHPVAGTVLDLGWLASWPALACLLLGIRDLSPAAAAKRAGVAGVVCYSAILHWFFVVTVVYGQAPAVVGVLAPLGSGFGMACFLAAFAAGCRWLFERGVRTPFAPALLWTALEHLRSVFPLSGFPWATLGYAQHENGALLGLSTLTGVYGLSFATVLGGAALAALAPGRDGSRGVRAGAWIAALTLVGLHGLGLAQRPEARPEAPVLRVAAVQGNVDQGIKWSAARAGEILDRYVRLSRQAAQQGAQLIVWPETALPGALEFDPALAATLAALAQETQSVLVVGGVGIEAIADSRDGYRYFDSAFVVGPNGSRTDRYDKTHLVPFGEYVPLRALVGRFVGAIATGVAPDDVTPGEVPRGIDLPFAPEVLAQTGAVRVGVPICYELLFPDLVRRFALDGGRLLLAITNDAWYGRTGAPYQFLAMTALRSAESGLWTVRAANTGVSAIIDAGGRVREQTRIFEQGVLVADLPLAALDDPGSFYVRHGDVFAWGVWAALAGTWGWAILGAARRAAKEGSSDE
jgi:apolipoprotein N-acyltransferase